MGCQFSVIGKSVAKDDAIAKVLGSAKYGADIYLPEMLYGKVLRSKVAHGFLKKLDVAKAQELPGVQAVITAADIPGDNSHGLIIKDEPVLVDNKIRKIGEPLAVVAAETEEIALKALKLIEVEIEELPGVFDPVFALSAEAPAVHEQGNLMAERKIIHGDSKRGFDLAETVVEGYYTTSYQEHAYIEPEVSIAQVQDDKIIVWTSTQNPHFDQKEIARNLDCSISRVRVIQLPTGGGFGGKLDISTQIYAALLALKSGRPVKMLYSREESLAVSTKRHPQLIRMKTGVDGKGRLIAMEAEIIADTGAYGSYGPGVITRSLVHATGPYEIPHVHLSAKFVYTNNPTSGAMRGFGVPQIAFAHEQQMDLLAEKIGMDPLEFRLLNCHSKGSVTATGYKLEHSVGIGKTILRAKEKFNKLPTFTENTRKSSMKKGVGAACMWYGIGNTGMPNPAGAFVDVMDDGTVIVQTGCADIGQGSSTVLAQIAAEELGVDFERITVISGDTLMTPDGGATSASRQTYISGNAVRLAAANAKKVIAEAAAQKLGESPRQLKFNAGKIYAGDDTSSFIPFGAAVQLCRSRGKMPIGSAWFNPDTMALDTETGQGKPYAAYAYATQIAEVEVDTETGQVKLLRLVAAHDVGRAINPVNVQGQIEGGCIMGQGLALYEDLIMEEGRIKTDSFSTYLMPTAMDAAEIIPLIVEEEEPTGPFGAKGVGEPALIPTAAAVANAIYDAVGIRTGELPIRADTLLQKLREKK